jgi:hypothetical protein
MCRSECIHQVYHHVEFRSPWGSMQVPTAKFQPDQLSYCNCILPDHNKDHLKKEYIGVSQTTSNIHEHVKNNLTDSTYR